MTTTKPSRNYKGFEIVETDSGFGARPKGTDTTIGLEGTLKGRKTIAQLKRDIDEMEELYG